jgi:L-seryl-tRNA(Ser) seleniumtransferase
MTSPSTRSDTTASLRDLPSVSELVATETGFAVVRTVGHTYAVELSRRAVERVRQTIIDGVKSPEPSDILSMTESELRELFDAELAAEGRGVINATGVIIHTNLGRAPLSSEALTAVRNSAGYTAVEYDLVSGKRGRRGAYAEELLTRLTGAEAALIVNNCAAAAFLVLAVHGKGKNVIVSRGELVEIGGDFRVPDVLERSGCILREVGTTNRTKIADYERAIDRETAILLKVHPSNYRITGFTASPALGELARLAKRSGVIFYEDAGSGALIDLSPYGLDDEPMIPRSVSEGVDIVTFSGDKLLGGPQAGIIVGRPELIEAIRRDPLYRALRVDKLTYAALEATLKAYQRGTAIAEIPVLQMLSMTADDLAARVEALACSLRKIFADRSDWGVETIDGSSVVGGGAAPGMQPASKLVAIASPNSEALALSLRTASVPVITRIIDGKVIVDLRTVFESQLQDLVGVFASLDLNRFAT